MAITVTCQACQFAFRVKDEFAGKAGKCPQCAAVVRVPGPGVSTASSVSTALSRDVSPANVAAKAAPTLAKSPATTAPTIDPLPAAQPAVAIDVVPMIAAYDAPISQRIAKKKPRIQVPVWVWFAAGGAVLFGALGWALFTSYAARQAARVAAEQRTKLIEDNRNRAPFNPDAAKAGATDPEATAPGTKQLPDAKVAPPTGP